MRITHTKEMGLFQEVTGVKQALVQQIVATVEEAYLADIHNQTTNSTEDTVADVLTHFQDNYGQLMPHKILEHEYIIKNMTYNHWDPIETILSAVKELFEFANITGTPYTQLQAVNIAYMIIHRTGKFGLEIHVWNCMPTIQKTWVWFKYTFCTAHRELQETSDHTIEDAGMHHTNMVHDAVAGLHEILQ